jgi:hypothetical protein
VAPDLCVLDALANDIEDLESVLRMLNSCTALGWATLLSNSLVGAISGFSGSIWET